MREIITLTQGHQAQRVALLNFAFQAEQIFDIDDEFDHNIQWDIRQKIKRPRLLISGIGRQLQGLCWLNQKKVQEIKQEQLKTKLSQIINKTEHPFDKLISYNLKESTNYVHYNSFPQQRFLYSQPFYSYVKQNSQQKLRKQLQECNSCSGVLNYIDIDSGLGNLGYQTLSIFLQMVPKGKITTFSINGNQQNKQRITNTMLASTKFKNISHIFIPLPIKNISFPYIKKDIHNSYQFQGCLSPILSCYTSSFTLKNGWSFYQFTNNIISHPSRNIFNCQYHLPINKSIMQTQQSLFFRQKYLTEDKKFSQYYTIRGQFKMPQLKHLSPSFDFKLNQQIFSAPKDFSLNFVHKQYLQNFPMQALFQSTSCQAIYLKQQLDQLKNCIKLSPSWIAKSQIQIGQMQQWIQSLQQSIQLYEQQ